MYTSYYAPPPPAPKRPTSPVVWVLVAMGLMTVLGGLLGTCGVVVGLFALGASQDQPSGVVLGSQVPETTVKALEAKNLLKPDETSWPEHDSLSRTVLEATDR